MMEPEFPLIRYFQDGHTYEINGHSTLVIGGAYSVDKWYRLARAESASNSFSGWFEDEQLANWEMTNIEKEVVGKKYDFIFTHTCPSNWEPTDLFISFIDQNLVDKTMENWLNKIKEIFTWGVWCFGHFHDDRIERPHVEQFFYKIENLEDVWDRWVQYDKTGELDLHLRLSPIFEKEMLYKELLKGE